MPPPTAVDAWLASRQFGIVIDAGSSGSRLQIYSWKNPRIVLLAGGVNVQSTLPKVEKGVREGEEWVSKVEPGLSTFAENPDGVGAHLAPLLEHARSQIPPSVQPNTPLFLLATAGMRLLPPPQQAQVLQSACHFLKFHSNFRIDDPSPAGPCGSSVRIITGEEEGLFGWIAVNYLMDGFTGRSSDSTTYGFLDMGGASTQIAFEPSSKDRDKSRNLIDVRLRLLGGEEIHHEVFVTTWLGYGTNQARERYVGKVIKEYEGGRTEGSSHASSGDAEIVLDPCLPKGLTLVESPVYVESATSHIKQAHKLLGTGSFEQCLQKTLPLLNKDLPCPDAPCLFNGVHVPPINFSVSHFIGVSEYWYSSDHVFGLGGPYDFVQYERAASAFCARDWDGILKEHKDHSGDGEVLKGGQVVGVGKWGDKVELPRLQMQCFKAAWIANVLHDGIGMPRIVDPSGNDSTHGQEVAKQAKNKGLGRPTFQSLDAVGNIAISWTLGKMVLEASKEVPMLSKSDRPLVDPLDDIPESAHNPIRPIRPPFLDLNLIEDQISQHLPASLTRQSLGFSPVILMFYMLLIFGLLSIAYRFQRQLKISFRRFRRNNRRRDRDITLDGYAMEEGKVATGFTGNSRLLPTYLLSTILRPLRRFISPLPRLHPSSAPSPNPFLRHTYTTSVHGSPTTGSSSPIQQHQNGSRSSSPASSYLEDGITHSSISSLPRSRNSSQMNLSTLVPRQMSRANSLQVPNGPAFLEE